MAPVPGSPWKCVSRMTSLPPSPHTQYVDIFSVDGQSFGSVAPEIFHRIPTGDARSVTQRPYKLSYAQAVWLKGGIDRLLKLGVIRSYIRPSSSPWMSPVVIVPKPNGSYRLCVDMRMLNKCTLPDPYPLPTVEEMHAAMGGCTLWSKMDFVSGFWQVEIHPDDCHKCGLTTPHGNFEFCRMVMGMQSAPSTFQRLMDQMLSGVEGAKTYIDDTFTFTADFEAQLAALRQVFERTREYKLTMNPSKCRFCVQEVVCLGHLVSAEGISPVMEVAAILELQPPANVKSMRGFLGMMEQYRKYIPGYARLAAPLQVMTRRSVSFVWTDECVRTTKPLSGWTPPGSVTPSWSGGPCICRSMTLMLSIFRVPLIQWLITSLVLLRPQLNVRMALVSASLVVDWCIVVPSGLPLCRRGACFTKVVFLVNKSDIKVFTKG